MIVTDHADDRVSVSVYGEFALADYREFEDLVNYRIKFAGPVDLFFDLREMSDFTLDVAIEELKFARAHANDFRRIAVVTDSQWLGWAAFLSQVFVNADVRIFAEADADEAVFWLDEAAA